MKIKSCGEQKTFDEKASRRLVLTVAMASDSGGQTATRRRCRLIGALADETKSERASAWA